MFLIIADGKVIGSYKEEPTEVPEDAELTEWDGDEPELRIVKENGVYIPSLPLDPRSDEKKLLSAKWRKLKEIKEWDENIRRAGVSIGPYLLRYDDVGKQQIISLLSQIRELVDQGVITGATLVSFEDASGNTHKVKASVIKSAIQVYFNACQDQTQAVGDLKSQLKAASTIQEVESITVGE